MRKIGKLTACGFTNFNRHTFSLIVEHSQCEQCIFVICKVYKIQNKGVSNMEMIGKSQIIIVTKDFLMELGYSLAESSKIIRLAKADLVSEGYDYYRGRKVGRVPLRSVEKILGYGLTDIYKNVKIDDVQTGKIVEAKLKFKEAL